MKDGHTRSYSLAGSPAQAEQLELHIRKRKGGLFSGMLFGNDPLIKEKTIMRVRGPMGTFTLNEEETQPIILLATGTGFAPIQSILLRLIEHNRSGRFTFIGAAATKPNYITPNKPPN